MRKEVLGHTEGGRVKSANFWIIVSLSIFYIVAILFLRGNDALELLSTGNLNDLGDFLAGFFTPLAFGWLVYGYFLQSKELRLQREELSLTRNQLGKQTELLQEQVTIDLRDTIPHLTLRIASLENWWDWIVENKGGNAKNIELLNLNEEQMVKKMNSLTHDESFRFTVTAAGAAHSYEARFSSERSERFHQCWKIEEGESKEITHGPEPLATEK